jgi:divalent metal cation (Fe/Co/Zn/Cd) transporter
MSPAGGADTAEAALLPEPRQTRWAWAGVRIEIVTVAYMLVEAAAAIGAGILASSVLLTAFGMDSVIELVTGGVLLWRLATQARGADLTRVEQAERRAAWVTGIGLVLLCVYIIVTACWGLLARNQPDASPLGLAVAVAALLLMPLLAARKRTLAMRLDSPALRGDAACSITCAYMAATLLIGLGLNVLFGWWWADSVAALALLYWLVPEAREALEGARAGRGACACAGDDDDCREGH